MSSKINIRPQIQRILVYIVLTLATLAVFWQVHQFDFVNLDDFVYVTENSNIQQGLTLDGLRWAFSTTYAEFWHPLTWISLMLDNQLYGLQAGGYHLTNLILHIMNALLLFWLFHRMTGAIWRSAFVAALFALHPLHVESVAWIAERKDVLSGFFWMLTLCLYVYYTEKPKSKRYLLVLLCFVCGLMSKSMVVTLPVILILLDYWPLGRLQSNGQQSSQTKIAGIIPVWQLREKIPFFILSAVFSFITFYAQYKPFLKRFPFSLDSRLANAPLSLVTYLEKMFWPHDLAVFYPFVEKLPAWQVWGSVLLIIMITTVVIVMVKRLPFLFVGWLWYGITLLPVIGIIQIGEFALADRYTYLSSIGITIMLAWGIPFLIKRADLRKKILFPAGVFSLVILSFLAWQQCGYWKDSIELLKHTLQVTQGNSLAHNNLGHALAEEGKINEAIDHYNEALRLDVDYKESYNNRGNAYTKLGQYQRSTQDYNEAIRRQPDFAAGYNNRGTVYVYLGQYQRAIEDYKKAISLQPDLVSAYSNSGNAYARLGQYQQAIKFYDEAIRRQPDNALIYYNRGLAYFNQGNKELGCLDAEKTCALGNCQLLTFAKGKGYCR